MTPEDAAPSPPEWRKCKEHTDVDGSRMWGCPDCLHFLRRRVAQQDEAIRQMQEELAAHDKIDDQYNAIATERDELHAKLAAKDEMIARLTEEVERCKTFNRQAGDAHEREWNRAERAEARIATLTQERDWLREDVIRIDNQREDAEAWIATLERIIVRYENDSAALPEDCSVTEYVNAQKQAAEAAALRCPCLHTTPCAPDCSCVQPLSSRGCSRCCAYGSPEQQQARAERLAQLHEERDHFATTVNRMGTAVTLCWNELTAAGHHALAERLDDHRGKALGLLTAEEFRQRLADLYGEPKKTPMTGLTHYVVVRRDLPYGILCAQLVHAAGESFYMFRGSSGGERAGSCQAAGEVDGSTPSRGANLGGSVAAPSQDGGDARSSPPAIPVAVGVTSDWIGETQSPGPCRGSSEKERTVSNREVAGLSPAPGSTFNSFDPSRTVAVVLGARNEHRLKRLVRQLEAAGIPHAAIYEPDAPWNGQLMAVGLVPGPKADLSDYVHEFHMLPVDGWR